MTDAEKEIRKAARIKAEHERLESAMKSRPGGNRVTIDRPVSQSAISQSDYESLSVIEHPPLENIKAGGRPFKELAPDEMTRLENSISEHGGILQPILAIDEGFENGERKGTIIDGHNRWQALKNLKGKGQVIQADVRFFEKGIDTETALKIAVKLQLNRRNLTPAELVENLEKLYPEYMRNEVRGGDKVSEKAKAHGAPLVETIAEETGLSTDKIKRAKQIHKTAAKEAKKKGRQKPTVEDMREAQAKLNAARKTRKTESDHTQKPSERMAGKGQPGYMSGNQRAGDGKENQLVTLKESLKIAHVCIDKLHGNKAAMKDAKKAVNDFMKGLLRYGI